MMDDLFSLSYGRSHDPDIDRWFAARPDELGHIARGWYDEVRATGDDILELIHDGCPVACVEDVPFVYIDVFTAHVSVGFFAGAFLPDPAHLLQGTGKRMRHTKISPVKSCNRDALKKLIITAYSDMSERVRRR